MEAVLRRLPPLLVILGLVLLLRLPFLNQAVLGDDDIYLTEAAHALIEPLAPNHTTYVFMGREVDLRGHSHPPLNAWILAALISLCGSVREAPFHAAYLLFSMVAALSMWSLSRRFSPRPLWSVLLFLAVPVFIVNGNSLESDLPFAAFWMASIACFAAGAWLLAAVSMVLAAMCAYQAIFLTPVLALYVWLFRRRDLRAWALVLVPPVAVASWQLFQRLSTGAIPAEVLAGYLAGFNFWNPRARIALLIHSWFLIFPALVPGALLLAWRKRKEPETLFLLGWIALFLACALIVFFAGSARYLLPMAAPLALLASRLSPRWLAVGFAAQLLLGIGLAVVNYQHWDAYRHLAADLRPRTSQRRVWVNGEWGLRHYLEADGALPLTRDRRPRAGDTIVVSQLGAAFETAGPLSTVAIREIRPAIPLRIIGLETASGYSTVSRGLWPFGLSSGVIDRVRVLEVADRRPTLESLPMNAPEAPAQIVSGIHDLEDHRYRWTSRAASVALKSPAAPAVLAATFTIPEQAAARNITLMLDGREVVSRAYAAPGTYTLESSAPLTPAGLVATVEILVDRTFQAPGDRRDLGIVLLEVGFKPLR